LKGLAQVRQASPIPVIADESVCRAEDIDRLSECVDGINIKLDKCGGLREARKMIETGHRRGLQIMLGCMVSTSLSTTALAHLASLADYLDLDGHLLIADDPFDGIRLQQGVPVLPPRPGIGVIHREAGSSES